MKKWIVISCFLFFGLTACSENSNSSETEQASGNMLQSCKEQLDAVNKGDQSYTYDQALLSKIIEDLELLGYLPNAPYVECSSEKDLASIKSDFMGDVLNMQVSSDLDDFLKTTCTQMNKADISKKYKAVYYYLVITQFGMGETYKNTKFIVSENFSHESYSKIPRSAEGMNMTVQGCLKGNEIQASGTIISNGKPPMGYEIHYKSTGDANAVVIAKGQSFNADGSFAFKGKPPEGSEVNLLETGGDISIEFTNGSTSIYNGNCEDK